MIIHFRDRSPEMVECLRREFRDIVRVPPRCCDIFSGPVTDAIVSPANSYGFFDGGIDHAYSQRWPWLQTYVQQISVDSSRVIPVGAAVVVSMSNDMNDTQLPAIADYGCIIVAPTMRVPEPISNTTNVYQAFSAALRITKRYPDMRTMTCPGFGTGVGCMSRSIAAFQMRMAFRHVFEKPFDPGKDTIRAITLEHALRTGDHELAEGL